MNALQMPRINRRALLLGIGAATAVISTRSLAGNPVTSDEVASPDAGDTVVPYHVNISQDALDDLRARLSNVRFPEAETGPGWSQGVPLADARRLIAYWRDQYDWRKIETRLNSFPQFRTQLDGLGFHFIHVKSKHDNAIPLVLTHGWPGSVLEFLDVIEPLTDPTAHGGSAEDAFHVVIPSLPGYGFSDKPTSSGWGIRRIARAWDTLMKRLGYDSYLAQGGDWGAAVATWMAKQKPLGLLGIHLNLPILVPPPPPGPGGYTDAEKAAVNQFERLVRDESAYAALQGTRPQTLGYGLADSPAAQAMWMYEKFHEWSAYRSAKGANFTQDQILDGITLYWLTNSGASSGRLYYESIVKDFTRQQIELPVAVSIFKGDIFTPPRSWGEQSYSNLVYWNELAEGGHFAAWEQPRLFVEEVRRGLGWARQK